MSLREGLAASAEGLQVAGVEPEQWRRMCDLASKPWSGGRSRLGEGRRRDGWEPCWLRRVNLFL
jgi:hypothetical protein